MCMRICTSPMLVHVYMHIPHYAHHVCATPYSMFPCHRLCTHVLSTHGGVCDNVHCMSLVLGIHQRIPLKKKDTYYVYVSLMCLAERHPAYWYDAHVHSVFLNGKTTHDEMFISSDVDVCNAEHRYLLQCFTGVGAEVHLP